jgi:hypothetical protein
MQILAVGRCDLDAGADVFCHERVIENRDICKGSTPRTGLKHRISTAAEIEHDMRRVGGSKPLPLHKGLRIIVLR